MHGESLCLAYCYGCRNAGDFAINQGTLSLLDRTVPDIDLVPVARFEDGTEEFRRIERKLETEGWDTDLVGGPIGYDPKSQSRVEQALSLAGDGLTYAFDLMTAAPRSRVHSELYRRITRSSGLLYNGGNAIHYAPGHRSLAYLLAVLYPLQIARRNRVPYALLPQTVFGIDGVAERLIVPILNDAEFVMTRDVETFRYLSEFGLSTHLIDAVDTALLCGRPTVGTGATTEPAEIAVVPRFSTLGDTGTLDQDGLEMEDTFVEYVTRLADAGFEVTLAIQTEMDRRWADRNRKRLAGIGVSRWRSFDPEELRTFYAGKDLLVTMRLHAGIFALSMGTPAIGVYRPEWGPKISGTWETLDIEHLALSWDEATTDRLLSATEEALTNRRELSMNLADRVSSVNEQLVGDFEAELNRG